MLRREAPISRHEPPEDILGLGDQGRLHYWAIMRYADIRAISRDPGTFCSGEGVQFRRRSTGDARGLAVVSGDGRPAAHQAARAGLGGVHASPGEAHRGRAAGARWIIDETAPVGGGTSSS
jgi:cytochrome P450